MISFLRLLGMLLIQTAKFMRIGGMLVLVVRRRGLAVRT